MKKIVVGIIVIILSIMVFLLLSNNKLTILEKYETLGFHEINEDGFKGYINNISNNEKEIKLYKNNKCYYKDIFTEEVKNVKVDNYNDCTEAGKTTSNKCYKVAIENDSAILTGFDYNCSKNAILPDVVTVSGVEYKLENIKEIEQDNEEVIQSIFLGVEKIRLPIHLNNIPNKMYSDNLISQIRIPLN